MQSPSERLDEALKNRHMSSYRLSKVSGMSQQHISKIRNGDRITLSSAVKLALGLGIGVEEVYMWQVDWDLYCLGGSDE